MYDNMGEREGEPSSCRHLEAGDRSPGAAYDQGGQERRDQHHHHQHHHFHHHQDQRQKVQQLGHNNILKIILFVC